MAKKIGTVCGLTFVSLVGLIPLLFTSDQMNKNKIDIYLFYDHLRYPENIAYDISGFLSVSFFIFLIWRLIPFKSQKRYVFCFLISSILNFIGYILFYSQYVSLIQIPILIFLLTFIYLKYDYEKGNNVG